MTTVVYLGDRILADTRATIQNKGFVGDNGDKVLINDDTVKFRTFDPGFMWDEERDIRMIGCSGTLAGIRRFTDFMMSLKCPMEQFIMTLGSREKGLLFKIIDLEKASGFILCLNTGESIRLVINARTHTYAGPDRKVKAIGSGAFYFEALKDVFEINPELVFRLAINTDPYSSKDEVIEGIFNKETGNWKLITEIFKYTDPLDPETLINGLNPHIKAILKGTLEQPQETPTQELPSDKPTPESVPVKIDPKKGKKPSD